MSKNLILIVFLLYMRYSGAQDEDAVLCSASYCAKYIDTSPCSKIPDECTIQNSTSSGIILPSNDPCNCCTYCLINLKKGEYCSAGEISSTVPDSICGPGLTCDASTETCVDMFENTLCTQKRYDYDTRRLEGTLGALEMRPNCDADGFYEPYMCIPEQNCFCVDTDGKRIFGETAYSQTASRTMKCECSRKYEAARAFLGLDILTPSQFFRCADNGDYDTIQCIGDNCMCADASDGAPTFPTSSFVNVDQISNTTLKDCFKPGEHLQKTYHYPCAAKYLELLEEIEAYIKDGYQAVFDVDLPKCDINGKYSAVQEYNGYAYCADFSGKQINEYKITSEEKADLEKNEINMNCYCARTRLLLENSLEMPQCCSNGNFNPIQCRRGKCYCVDDNGYQNINNGGLEENEVDEDEQYKLHCYSNSVQYCK